MTRITFFVHWGKEYTVEKYLARWGQDLRSHVRVRHYPGLHATGRTAIKRFGQRLRARRVGVFSADALSAEDRSQTYVFTDLERLDVAEMAGVQRLWDTLATHPSTARMFNHPGRALRRFELLEALHAQGINQFGVYRAGPGVIPRQWPVFVREANDHSGSLSALCHDVGSLEQALTDLGRRTRPGAEIMIAEFCDVADAEGVIRKFGAFRVGDEIIARQIHFSRHWVVREPDIKTDVTTGEELDYVETNPHRDALRAIFDLACIDYGRIDYSLVEGRIQVWEINTNPIILITRDRDDPLRCQAHGAFGQRFTGALRASMAVDQG